MRTLLALAFAYAFASLAIACSDSAPACEPGFSTASQNLASSCDGQVQCTAGSTETSATLRRDANGNGCTVQGTTLLPGGTVEGNADASWTGDADTVRVCQGPSCFTCRRSEGTEPGPSSAAKPKEKSCKGSSSCPSSPPCSEVRGCSLRTHYRYDEKGNVSNTEYSCDGAAADCSSMSTMDSCERQGCRWE
jgi:hypothetical protein